MKLITELEEYRKANNLKRVEMAKIFGVEPQNYNNWVYRRSLPKEHIEKAKRVLGHTDSLSDSEMELLESWRDLSPESQRLVIAQFKVLRQGNRNS